jgi:hypothetical protein
LIEKLEFYHGAALVRVIQDPRCKAIATHPCGYQVNGSRVLAIKYSTKAHSPWGFTFTSDDFSRLNAVSSEFGERLVALVCGGDGVCVLTWTEASTLLDGLPGRIGTKRGFAGCYAVSGAAGQLKGKVAMNRWPAIVFEPEQEI